MHDLDSGPGGHCGCLQDFGEVIVWELDVQDRDEVVMIVCLVLEPFVGGVGGGGGGRGGVVSCMRDAQVAMVE